MNTAGVRLQIGDMSNINDPKVQADIDLVGKGQVDLNTVLQRTPPAVRGSFLAGLAAKYPDFHQYNFDVGKKVAEYFTSGEGGKTLNNFNTATEHLGQLQKLGEALQNGDIPLVNQLSNAWKTATGEAAPSNFNTVKAAVSGEIGKTFKGNVTDEELKTITANVSNAQSPEQLKGFIDQSLALMKSKIHASATQYGQGVQGKPAFPAEGTAGGVNDLVNKYK
jgi:hypothetical protein